MELNAVKYLKKWQLNDNKSIPKFLKFMGKINTAGDYELYKETILKNLFDWFIETQIRAFLICLSLLFCLSAMNLYFFSPTHVFFMAEGLTFLWYLTVQFKQDLWRKN